MAGAVICGLFFSKLLVVNFSLPELIVLGFSVWIIYSADHLLDVSRFKWPASTMRHRFYQKHFKVLMVTNLVCIGIVLLLLTRVSTDTIMLGMFLIPVVTVYLFFQKYFGFAKEFFGAVLYSAGVLLPALSIKLHLDVGQSLVVIQFVMVAWINLLVFSVFDKQTDEQDQHVSFVTKWGEKNAIRLTIILFAISGALTVFQFSQPYAKESLLIFTMELVLTSMIVFRSYFAQSDRFRFLGDAVFLFPLAIWWL